MLTVVRASAGTFPDAHERPPAGWQGPVFELSQEYPTELPAAEPVPWDGIDFTTAPEAYARAVLRYVYEGNREAQWIVQRNRVRRWYHAPWLHAGDSGREFVHGMTRERSSRPGELHPLQTSKIQNWAVGFYNPRGGWVLGRVWKDPKRPDATAARFPDGAVSAKLLFTAAPVSEVPYLKEAEIWKANIAADEAGKRAVQDVRLLQIDVAVRDARNDARTGWVFGTFMYDPAAPGATPWDRMVPVGLQWGNDPGITPTMVAAGTKLAETWVNREHSLPQHLGWGGRLNGPVDNPASSCVSCHGTAQHRAVSPLMPDSSASDETKLRWFRNLRSGEPFDAGQQSLDYSLQLAAGIQQHALATSRPEAAGAKGLVREFLISREGLPVPAAPK
jgi:hypothetical protein